MEAAGHLLKGRRAALVAAKFGVSRTTASRWQRVIAEKGVDSLKRRKAPGRPRGLSAEQLVRLAQICGEAPSAHGLPHEHWTVTLVAQFIEERFGFHYSRDHVGRLVSKLGFQPMSIAGIVVKATSG
jgi:transposase